jgi:hypothetical protein
MAFGDVHRNGREGLNAHGLAERAPFFARYEGTMEGFSKTVGLCGVVAALIVFMVLIVQGW